ncbi:hypothetical protein [Phenylobacterium sp. SCN 70-31]|uniref:hypothetical protein n=1 Tax=Phenylobacterium sp. SCN 70-31 TaxID=1660129 RepID=UPI00086E280E|nr:hypothetical protein [Phenylobacterium sp. SCN 70-31]ODT86018.1 MAG: hypothetical protein ABS78_17995 [Phenylobacterium sp. SCN 70-31]
MPIRFQARHALPVAVALAVLTACAEQPKTIAPPPPPPVPSVMLSPQLVEMASAYRRYLGAATAITPVFTDGPGVAGALRQGATYEPQQLTKGAIAYGAIVALQDPAFVAGVRVYARDPAQRRQVVHELLKDPAYAVGLAGSQTAASHVIAALGGDAQRLYDAGKQVKQAAYDIQKQPWSRGEVAGRDARLAGAKSLSAAAMSGDANETARLQHASTGGSPFDAAAAQAAAPPYTPTVIRSLALAALAVLGEAGDANLETVMGLVVEPNIGSCMNFSKLNLYQCLAVARPHYEDVFCLGQHAMMDTGRCMIRAAGLPEPHEPRFVPDASSIARGMPAKKAPAKAPAKKPAKKS